MGRPRGETICVTHEGDLDGLASAALASLVWEADVVPVGYGEMVAAIEGASATRLVITDLAVTGKLFHKLLASLKRFEEVVIVDHHPLGVEERRALEGVGVKLVHDVRDCTTVLAYHYWKPQLPAEASRLAAYAALTDYMEDGPLARPIVERFERVTLFLEASLYALAIIRRENSKEGLRDIVAHLREFKRPQESGAIVDDALQALARLDRLRHHVATQITRMGEVGIVETGEEATGTIAALALEVGDCPVALAYRREGDHIKVSSRSVPSFRVHLGEVVARAADLVGGVGGGHMHATGARIPRERMEEFLTIFLSSLSR
jgi:RecJ-like exonuclease